MKKKKKRRRKKNKKDKKGLSRHVACPAMQPGNHTALTWRISVDIPMSVVILVSCIDVSRRRIGVSNPRHQASKLIRLLRKINSKVGGELV